ncbi:MAG: alpha/beta hydrolase [Fretibacterium sp.]|nr:alpha/beta hydrolase [Fretibacterium sp.]
MTLKQLTLSCLLILASLILAPNAFAQEAVEMKIFPLERNGVQLHLARYQITQAQEGQTPLLMVHGLTYSSHEFDVDYKDYSLARFFAREGFSVWLLDIAGYGQSQPVEDGFMPDSDYAAEDINAAVDLILKESGAKKLNILGWSWGTVTSGRFAAKYGDEKINRLVLYAPIVAGLAAIEVKTPFNHNTWEHAADDFQRNEDKTINYEITEPGVVGVFLSNCWRYDKESSPNGGRKDLLVDPKERLIPTASINVPTLLIVGDKDPYVSPALCEEAKKSLPNEGSKLVVLEGASHSMMMEAPYYKEFRKAVLDFLKD